MTNGTGISGENSAPDERTAQANAADDFPEMGLPSTETEQKLEGLGFERVGTTELFERDGLLLSVQEDGTFSVFTNFSGDVEASKIEVISRGEAFNGFSLLTFEGGKDFVNENTMDISRSSKPLEKVPKIAELRHLSLSEQLQQAGFTEDTNQEGLFRIQFEEYGENYEVIAIVEDGTISRLSKTVEDRGRILTSDLKVARFENISSDRGESSIPTLVLSDGLREVGLSSRSGYVSIGAPSYARIPTAEELGIKSFEIITEASGFQIGGTNTSDTIRSIDSLNGIPISRLEQVMRPMQSSGAGFLGANESLIDVLVADNDFVHSRGLTHQQLATALRYAITYSGTTGQAEFTYNGNQFSISVQSWRGQQPSPFNDGTVASRDMFITNLRTGKALGCSYLLPDMIERYGFYEGKGTGYRLEPQDVIEVFELDEEANGKYESDPVVTLGTDANAYVAITTSDQLERLLRLPSFVARGSEASQANYQIVVDNVDLLHHVCAVVTENERFADLLDRVDLKDVSPVKLTLDRVNQLFPTVYSGLPDTLKEAMLDSISQIALKPGSDWDEKYQFHQLFKGMLGDEAYAEVGKALLGKVDINEAILPAMIAGFREAVPTDYKDGKREPKEEELTKLGVAVDEALPELRQHWLRIYEQAGVTLQADTSLADLYRSSDKLDAWIQQVDKHAEFIRNIGGRATVQRGDVVSLMSVMTATNQEADYRPNEGEAAALERLRVEAELVQYALEHVRGWGNGGNTNPVGAAISQLFNGAAEKEREKAQIAERIPQEIGEQGVEAVKRIIKVNLESFGERIDIDQLLGCLKDKGNLGEQEVLAEYMGVRFPPYAGFFQSKYVTLSFGGVIDPISAELDIATTSELPQVESDALFGKRIEAKYEVGDSIYIIGADAIRVDGPDGRFSLRVNGSKITSLMQADSRT